MFTTGPMDVSTRVNGRIIKWKAKGHSNGPTAAGTKDSTSMTRKRAREPSTGKFILILIALGRMDVNTRGSGLTESKTALAHTRLQVKKPSRDSGRRASASLGCEALKMASILLF